MSDFSVKIGSLTFRDFESVFLRKSMETLTGGAYFKTANFFLQTQEKWNIYLEDSFSAYIGKNRMVKGKIDDIDIDYDKIRNETIILGRDDTADLVDCCWDTTPNEWKKQSISSIIRTICSQYGISVTVDSSATSSASNRIDSFKISEGEKVYNAIKRLCIENQVLPISYGDGKLTLTQATNTNYAKDQIDSTNIIKGYTKQSNIKRFNSYHIKGYGKESSFKAPKDYLNADGSATDSLITNTKRKYVHLSDTEIDYAKAINQAKFLKNMRAGHSRSYIYHIKDWMQSNGSPWELNQIVSVKDKMFKLEKQLLIWQIDYTYNWISPNSGFVCIVYLVDRNTYTTNNMVIKSGFDK